MSKMTDNSEFRVEDEDVQVLTLGEWQRRQSAMTALRRLLVRSWRDDDDKMQKRYTLGSFKTWEPVAFRFYNESEASVLAVPDASGKMRRVENDLPRFEMVEGFDADAIKVAVAAKTAVTSIHVPQHKNFTNTGWKVEILLFKKQDWLVDRPFSGDRLPHGGKRIELDPNARLQKGLFD
jgi:hypothetical protein